MAMAVCRAAVSRAGHGRMIRRTATAGEQFMAGSAEVQPPATAAAQRGSRPVDSRPQ